MSFVRLIIRSLFMVSLVLKSQPPAHLTFIGLSLILKYESAGISTGTCETGLFRNPEGACLFLSFFEKLC